MPAPNKVWVVIPTVLTATPIPIVQHPDEDAAKAAAVKAAITTGVQCLILEAVAYVEPVIPTIQVDALVLPIP